MKYHKTFTDGMEKLMTFQDNVTLSLGKILREYEDIKVTGLTMPNDLDLKERD